MNINAATSFTIIAHRPLSSGSSVQQRASVSYDATSCEWLASATGGSMGWVTRPLEAARGESLLARTTRFLDQRPDAVRGALDGRATLEITTPETGTRHYAVDTLGAQDLVHLVFAATGRAPSHGRVVRHH